MHGVPMGSSLWLIRKDVESTLQFKNAKQELWKGSDPQASTQSLKPEDVEDEGTNFWPKFCVCDCSLDWSVQSQIWNY